MRAAGATLLSFHSHGRKFPESGKEMSPLRDGPGDVSGIEDAGSISTDVEFIGLDV
jgi:hypothetical protein